MPGTRTIRIWLGLGLLLLLQTGLAAPQLSATPDASSDGVSVIAWGELPGDAEILLQRATTADFSDAHQLYRGVDGATTVTGMTDGDWYFRARLASDPAWSETVQVRVHHHSLTRAFGFFAVGALVFICTVLLIAFGSRRADAT